ncbi:M15 family metallopeptidase [Cellulomonas sp. zg-ZUI222]|uniref:M15 family metallopeptidase n=1 Tax=Cellulomonas wangleii TaxID=2816956 RepID=A0ABX8D6G0_9CELL|nr:MULTISPECIES: M15 family metallopeptidase [Cellulomonas]MBO0901268.1 M15 family metallopeptidase [Cellulomonas sp. zg-ZUI22]MBO0922423.1 M15 family metallopeptidase [Cellulomonas wangleii]MBO0924864.1 M15 family metallopeptidase [Cellulomonas wangleii]QVI63030.1 M15 family metallopeptidase [Cellulomonas wangleii]
MVDGIAAIAARMAHIRGLVAPAAVVASPATTTATGTAFADALSRATATYEPAAPPAPTTTVDTSASSVRRINGDMLPQGLAGHANGRVPDAALTPVGDTGHRLWQPAAQQLTRMIADARAQGVTIGITDSYRTYDTQVDLVRRKGLYSQGGLAAAPGTSDHGWGLAADLRLDATAQAWMRANADRYGFAEDTPREPWHWAYQT